MADAIAKFWVMPRTGTALSPVDSTSAGVTATKGFNLAADLIGGLPELEDQITPSPSCPIRMKVAPCDEDMTLRDAV